MKYASLIFSTTLFYMMGVTATPIVSDIYPQVGPAAGEIEVTIKGSGFKTATAVQFGKKIMPVSSLDDETIIIKAPKHNPQVVSVKVLSSEGNSIDTPDSFFVYQGNTLAFVANQGTSNISVIDTSTDRVLFTETVGNTPYGIAISHDGTKAFVPNYSSNNVSVIDLTQSIATERFTVGKSPCSIAVTSDGSTLLVSNLDDGTVSIFTFDGVNRTEETLSIGNNPTAIAISPDNHYALIGSKSDDFVSLIDLKDSYAIKTINVESGSTALAFTPSGSKAMVLNTSDGTVSIIDFANDFSVKTLKTGTNPMAIAITPDGKKAYIANHISNNITEIDIENGSVTGTTKVGTSPISLAITPDGKKALVVNYGSSSISVIDIEKGLPKGTVTVGTNPIAIAINPEGTKAYVTNDGNSNVSIIDLSTLAVLSSPSVGKLPNSVTMNPDQAPFAKFSMILGEAGKTSYFDANRSASPVGTIVKYQWNFGDGTIVETDQPTISHLFLAEGIYTVTLKVTNSAGTSTEKLYSPSSSMLYSWNSSYMTHHGSSLALASKTVRILPQKVEIIKVEEEPIVILPVEPTPEQPQVIQPEPVVQPLPPIVRKAGKCFNPRRWSFIYFFSWKAPTEGSKPVSYLIYRDSDLSNLAGEVAANSKLYFVDHHPGKRSVKKYYIISVDEAGNRSAPAVINPS